MSENAPNSKKERSRGYSVGVLAAVGGFLLNLARLILQLLHHGS